MPSVEFQTHPPKPPRGFQPIGSTFIVDPEPEALQFTARLGKVSDALPWELADMHRLIYIGQTFTRAGLLRCLRLKLGRRHATWIEGMIEMLAAEEAAQAKAQNEEEDHQL